MTLLEAVIFGAIQGATEFLPVSSSGHLAVAKAVMDLSEVPILFDVILHVATLAVVCFVFREKVLRIVGSLWRWVTRRSNPEDALFLRLAWVIALATIFTGAIGIALNEFSIGEQPRLVSAMFLVTALVLVASRLLRGERGYESIGWKDAVIVGIAQGLGVVPGISRSGITISAGRLAGMDRERAGEFAFLVSIPAILGALVLSLGDAGELQEAVGPTALIVGFATALVVGLVALLVLVRLIRSGRLYLFAFYLLPLGLAGLIWL